MKLFLAYNLSVRFLTVKKLTLACLCTLIAIQLASAQSHRPPAKPAVAPLIGNRYANDTNGDRIDDELFHKTESALAAQRAAVTPLQVSQAQTRLNEMVDVELIFNEQISQAQIDAFLAMGGEITHIFKAVSYGWNGRIPLKNVHAVPGAMGSKFLLLHKPVTIKGGLFEATSSGRVRPIWATGFAGSSLGYSGSTNITIGFSDSGIDADHPDLNGRGVFWNNYVTDESAPTPVDFYGHGTGVAGIALGSGAASGSAAGPLSFVQSDTLAGASSGSFVPCPFELPPGTSTVTLRATWSGGTVTSLRLASYLKVPPLGSGLLNYAPSVTSVSPLTLTVTVTGDTNRVFTPRLNANGSMSNFIVSCTVSNYPATPDGFNRQRGVAPGCNWAMGKTTRADNTGQTSWVSAALDDLVALRIAKNIKVINISEFVFGDPGIDTTLRAKVNTAVNNGIVVVAIAANDGTKSTPAQREIDDPGRAAYAITVGAANDNNQLTDYTSVGFTPTNAAPTGQEQDTKPDLMAPGGSSYYTLMTSVDTGYSDGAFPDQIANDYSCAKGTSEAAPFVSGCAALVIQALEAHGLQWDFNSNQQPLFIKSLLCATASESNMPRENNSATLSPTLQRATVGAGGYPGKDIYEGYGMINPEAAIEAVVMTYTNGSVATATLGPSATDRRVWARKINLPPGRTVALFLTNPPTGDFDLYLYSAKAGTYGNPWLLASSAQAGNGVNESINYPIAIDGDAFLVVKRVSGFGSFNLIGNLAPAVDFSADTVRGLAPLTVNFTNLTIGATNFTWDFGDGNSTTATNPANNYTNAGIYTVSLVAVGPGGTNSLTKTGLIVVTNLPPPVVSFTAIPTEGQWPLYVSFNNTTTGETSNFWDFGDGNTSTLKDAYNTYSGPGKYSVTLTAVGAGGTNSLTLSGYINVTNPPPPSVDFAAAPTTGFAPVTVVFTGLVTGATNYQYDFGDGDTSSSKDTSHTYTNAGTYSVTFTAIGPGGTNSLSKPGLIVVTNASVHYVSLASANPAAPFATWETAATNIQDAIDAADTGEEVVVTNGVYGSGQRVIYGTTNRVVLTRAVRLRSVNGPGVTIIQGDDLTRCVYITNGLLAGFTLTNGHASSGGGVYCATQSEIVSNCLLIGNVAYGYRDYSSNACNFYPAYPGCGGGACGGTLQKCTLVTNLALGISNSFEGSMWFEEGQGGGAFGATLNNCILDSNHADRGGGANESTLNSCLLIRNSATSGGGTASLSYEFPAVGQWGPGGGCDIMFGEVGSEYPPGVTPPSVNNCTLVWNAAGQGGGSVGIVLNNCIVLSNSAPIGPNLYESDFNHCCTSPLPYFGIGNFTNAPLFVDAINGDFHLLSGSPCINAGKNAFSTNSTDLDGNPRVAGGTVDVGAYEFQSPQSLISYAWLQQYGLPIDGSADFTDPDGDGHNNWQEWRAWTDPKNPASALRLLSPSTATNGIIVRWQSVSEQTYFLERATNLSAQPAFVPLASNLLGQAGTTLFTDTNTAGPGPYFYRVGVR